MAQLPDDAFHQIFALLSKQTLSSCRLLDKRIGRIATEYAFRHMRLEAAHDVHRFVNVANSDLLRQLVREITVDTWIGPDFQYNSDQTFRPPRDFFRALAYIRRFKGLKSLNLRFNEHCGSDERDGSMVDETQDFRFLVLDIVFRCLAGEWPQANRPLREESLVAFDHKDKGSLPPIPTEGILEMDNESLDPLEISTLTIQNLAAFDDERLTNSVAFKQVIPSKSLSSLKLLVAIEKSPPRLALAAATFFREQYDFCHSLPRTWLSPAIAQSLKCLSLYFQDYWGWNPKMDFRSINPGNRETSGFPNLRVLALGNYVFSHQWQVEWFASSVGQNNGRGGLEELYLDDCPVMWQARTLQPMDESITVHRSEEGEVTTYSNTGYPLQEVMTAWAPQWNPDKFSYPLRWHSILKYWKKNLSSLKVFKIGHGSWGIGTIQFRMKPGHELTMAQKHQWTDTAFLDYDCPSPPEISSSGHRPEYALGVGLDNKREHILQYVHFDIGLGPSPWIERDFGRDMIRDEGYEVYQTARELDEEAYLDLMHTVLRRESRA